MKKPADAGFFYSWDDLCGSMTDAQHAMKKTATKTRKPREPMRAEYDFSGGVRGKHHKAYSDSSNVIVLEPDVAARFTNSRSVNTALRAVLKAAEQARR